MSMRKTIANRLQMPYPLFLLLAIGAVLFSAYADSLSIRVENIRKPISKDLMGVFFEDLNFAADGGLYAEMIQNRTFEYSPACNMAWHGLSFWSLVEQDGKGSLELSQKTPYHPNSPQYAVLTVSRAGGGVGLKNEGFDGFPLKQGETYLFSCYVRREQGDTNHAYVRLETADGHVLATAHLDTIPGEWTKLSAELTPSQNERDARLVLLFKEEGTIAVDMVSLFPKTTFKGRPNGLRADLAQAIADLKPRFVRFPGGCLAHGDGLENIYNWKRTIGPVEQRRFDRNIWRYGQTFGLGYFEYFQFCEDIGATPLPVVAAGVSCQNSGNYKSAPVKKGQDCIPLEQMPAYIQDILDLIEFANGPASSTWGKVRAEMGHPEPFNLRYLGVGNEDKITPEFEQRYKMIEDAIYKKYPELIVCGTVGPFHSGRDFEAGWAFADKQGCKMVDEHYYVSPDWFWDNLNRYDSYDRKKSAVYLGEYAAHDKPRVNTLRGALAEAAYLTALERNGDIVRLASYAPLLSKQGRTQWVPDMIYFDNHSITRSLSYTVQQLFSLHAGDTYLQTTLSDSTNLLASSCVCDPQNDLILKLVSRAKETRKATLDLSAVLKETVSATIITLSGDEMAVNVFGKPPTVVPIEKQATISPLTEIEIPPCSLTVIRCTTKKPPHFMKYGGAGKTQ
jgi:alpha-N-arabinofuranosidase